MNNVRSLAFLFLLVTACSRPQNHAQLDAYVSREDDHWLSETIPVCFEQAQGYASDRTLIQSVVSREFARAGIYFSGWAVCTANDAGIRISFDENAGQSKTLEIGRKNAGLIQNLVIGLKSRCAGVFSGSVCEGNIALHEFGHALGLHHEMNRRDNVSCGQDQTSGEGEDALQIGAYDASSIMDYCRLYGANARMEALPLSEQDVAALGVLKKGLVASLDKPVPMLVSEVWSGFVKGSGLSSYRFAVTPKDEQACETLKNYSPSLPLAQPITIDPEMMPSGSETIWSLCLLGEKAGERQDLKVFSAMDFRVLNTIQVSADGSDALALTQNPYLYRDGSAVILDLNVGNALPLRSLYASLAYSDTSIYKRISNARFESRNLGAGHYQIVFAAADFPANGEVYLGNLDLTDITGQKLSLFSSAAWESFFGHPWLSPALMVTWSFDNDGRSPVLTQLNGFPSTIQAGQQASFTMQIEENSRVQNIRLVLKSGEQTLEPALRWQKLDATSYRVDMDVPGLTVNGSYKLDSLGLEDIMDNRSYYSLAGDSDVIADTTIPMPALAVQGGLAYETEAPELIGIRFSTTQYKRGTPAYVDLDIKDASGIKQVQLNLRHVSDQGFYKTIYGLDQGDVAGVRRIQLNTDAHHPVGTYLIHEIMIVDRFGNTRVLNGDEAAGRVELLDQ